MFLVPEFNSVCKFIGTFGGHTFKGSNLSIITIIHNLLDDSYNLMASHGFLIICLKTWFVAVIREVICKLLLEKDQLH